MATSREPGHNKSMSEAELEVLKALWDAEAATVRELQAHFERHGKLWAYTTVQTLVQRLEEKGYVGSDRTGRAHVFRATVSRDAHLDAQLDDLVERVCDGTASPLVLALVERSEFSPDDIARFRAMLDDLETDQSASKKKGRKSRS